MIIHSNTNGTATLVVNLKELATIDCALSAYAASSTVNVHPDDIERSNAMEQACFKVFVSLSEKESASRA